MITIFIGLGSNLEDKIRNCERAVYFLAEHPEITVIKVSKWYKSKAMTLAGETHPDFINGAVQAETPLYPLELVHYCKSVEYELGRKAAAKKWQPRIIDIDLLFYGDRILKTNSVVIPHPSLHERIFVLKPLKELVPQWRHPVLNKTVEEMFASVLQNAPI